jgi:hypothetical protein
MPNNEAIAKLTALHKAVSRYLENPRAMYFDYQIFSEWFARWEPVREALCKEHPTLFDDLPKRSVPSSSGTTDFDGRGYVQRGPVQQLHDDMQFVLDALAAVPSVSIPSLKVTREGIFFAGQYFDALREVTELIAQAKTSIVLIDAYVSSDTLSIVSEKQAAVVVRILTHDPSGSLKVAAQAFQKQFGALEIRSSKAFHDRFLILDDRDCYHFGASIKDLGHRGFMFSKIEEAEVVDSLRRKFLVEWQSAVVVH